MKKATKLALLLAALALPLGAAQSASAALTPAGTVINNQATLEYKVGGYAQNAVPSTATEFHVDRKVNFTVNYVPGTAFVDVFPGAQNQALTYTVTNLGNDTQDFDLAVTQLSGGTVLGSPDTIEAGDMRLFLDNGTTPGVFDSGDTDITTAHLLDEVAADQTVTVFVVGNFNLPQFNGNVAGITVAATALHGHGAGTAGAVIAGGAVTDTNGAVPGKAIYTVFADVADASPNFELVAGAFRIAAPVLSVNKVHSVIWDPVNFSNTPRSIPGSLVQYTITIANAPTALASASLTTIQDTLDVNTTLDADFLGGALNTATPTATSGNGQSFRVTHTSGRTALPEFYANGTGVTVAGQSITADFTTLLPEVTGSYSAGELKPNESVTITFNIKIN